MKYEFHSTIPEEILKPIQDQTITRSLISNPTQHKDATPLNLTPEEKERKLAEFKNNWKQDGNGHFKRVDEEDK